MTSSPINQIKKFRTQKGLSQAQLAEAVGAHWITISKLERGKIRLTQSWMNKLSAPLGVNAADLIDENPLVTEIEMSGLIAEQAGKIKLLRNDPNWTSSQKFKIDLGSFKGDRDVWITMGTDRFYPVIHPGDFVRFTYLGDMRHVESLINRLCLVHTAADEDIIVGFLRWIGKRNVYDLDIPGSSPVRNVNVEDIAGATLIVGHPQLAERS